MLPDTVVSIIEGPFDGHTATVISHPFNWFPGPRLVVQLDDARIVVVFESQVEVA